MLEPAAGCGGGRAPPPPPRVPRPWARRAGGRAALPNTRPRARVGDIGARDARYRRLTLLAGPPWHSTEVSGDL